MIDSIDHIVLTVRDPDKAAAFYTRVLGMEPITFGNGRRALRFGNQKINLQSLGQETRNHACIGSGDLCLLTQWPSDRILSHLAAEGVAVVEGPVTKSGARGPITSIYINDPDGNLVEISRYDMNAAQAPREKDVTP
ncbi:MAG: VOC family protein [Paracoccaceae bacterium]|nr:VOC family protein [Paracoccaceae bacterium]MDE3238995.1 VOC family protein [Paracoccaceae bacterium]